MDTFTFSEHPHRRFNPLTGTWILCSPHRAKRPWQGQVEKQQPDSRPAYEPTCYLCPGNNRTGGDKNPEYTDPFVFQNDFSALLTDTPNGTVDEHSLLVARSNKGICRVVCFSPKHNLTLPEMDEKSIRKVIDTWEVQYRELGALEAVNYVQIFENKGAMMGCSNPHPHGQIWASEAIPEEPAKEVTAFSQWNKKNGTCLLCDYTKIELEKKVRIVCENGSFLFVVPFWALWPYEVLVLAKEHQSSLTGLSDTQKDDLADILKRLACRYDNLFETSFPYSMGIHQAPTDGNDHSGFHFHLHFYPPLLRSATVKKFMVGYEMLAEPQRDLTAEQSAERLRGLSEVHYKMK
jgi:UDPglucose--hexose-1-phosphate uridylyltransferase